MRRRIYSGVIGMLLAVGLLLGLALSSGLAGSFVYNNF
jgi:hypothetical protein